MKVIGHRGARGLAPENTLASIQAALDTGVDAVEIDVRVTTDSVVVLCHDSCVCDATGRKFVVSKVSFDELQRAKPDIATLDSAMDLVKNRCDLIVEIKSQVKLSEVISLSRVKLAGGFPSGRLAFASFDQAILLTLQREMPETPLIINEIWSSWRARRRARQLGTHTIALLEYWVWPGFIRAMKRAGYELYVYPSTNDRKKARFRRLGLHGCSEYPARAQKWASFGLTGIITDQPELFQEDRALLAGSE